MSACKNCGYELVLLSHRPKYKCALCSRLYPQKEVENINFRNWNKKQRENDLHNLKLEIKQRKKIATERSIFRAFRLLFRTKKPRLNLSLEERKKRKHEANKRWERRNPEKVRAINRRRVEKHRAEINAYMKKWRVVKQYESRLKQRLAFRRSKQRQLTLQLIENEPYKLSSNVIEKLLPTSALTQLLTN